MTKPDYIVAYVLLTFVRKLVYHYNLLEQYQYPYETNVNFPNSPYLGKFTVMGVVIVAKNLYVV